MESPETLESDDRGVVVACSHCGRQNRLPYASLTRMVRCGQCQTEFPAINRPVHVTLDAGFQALTTQSALPVLVDFWAPWCGPCKMVAPELNKVAVEGASKWIIAKVDTEELPGLARAFQISAIPTLVLFARGREVARRAGALPAAGIRQLLARAT
jgi:thioredoxin 2